MPPRRPRNKPTDETVAAVMEGKENPTRHCHGSWVKWRTKGSIISSERYAKKKKLKDSEKTENKTTCSS